MRFIGSPDFLILDGARAEKESELKAQEKPEPELTADDIREAKEEAVLKRVDARLAKEDARLPEPSDLEPRVPAAFKPGGGDIKVDEPILARASRPKTVS